MRKQQTEVIYYVTLFTIYSGQDPGRCGAKDPVHFKRKQDSTQSQPLIHNCDIPCYVRHSNQMLFTACRGTLSDPLC